MRVVDTACRNAAVFQDEFSVRRSVNTAPIILYMDPVSDGGEESLLNLNRIERTVGYSTGLNAAGGTTELLWTNLSVVVHIVIVRDTRTAECFNLLVLCSFTCCWNTNMCSVSVSAKPYIISSIVSMHCICQPLYQSGTPSSSRNFTTVRHASASGSGYTSRY